MTDIVISSPEPEAEAPTVVVVEPTAPVDTTIIDLVTRVTRLEDSVTVLAGEVASIGFTASMAEGTAEAAIDVAAEAAATAAVAAEVAVEASVEDEPEAEPTHDDEPPASKVHRWWK